jgi:hypothetical protein
VLKSTLPSSTATMHQKSPSRVPSLQTRRKKRSSRRQDTLAGKLSWRSKNVDRVNDMAGSSIASPRSHTHTSGCSCIPMAVSHVSDCTASRFLSSHKIHPLSSSSQQRSWVVSQYPAQISISAQKTIYFFLVVVRIWAMAGKQSVRAANT